MADSPRHNSNLLSRAELVALVNTLHRLSESLYYVNSFRKMWAETDKLEEQRLLKGAEQLVSDGDSAKVSPHLFLEPFHYSDLLTIVQPPRHSPNAESVLTPQSLLEDMQRWVWACQQGAMDCVRGIILGLNSLIETVTNLFKLSGKENGPHMEL